MRLLFLWLVPLLRLLPFRRRTIMREGRPYLTRIYLTPSTGALGRWWRARFRGRFLHCFHMSDPDGLHNHPWRDARSLILRGAYCEERRGYWTTRIFWPGMTNVLNENDWHRVDLMSDEVWTLFSPGAKHGKGWCFSTGRRGTSDES